MTNTIERELEKIWDSLQEEGKMRACLFNLIIYAKKTQRVGYLNEMTKKIIQKFPCRIIFITHDEACSSSDLKTAVSVMTADEGNYEIACDLIEVEVCQKDHPKVPFVILPHLIPDLPIYLVHADDPTLENPIAQSLESLANRIIFDSEATCNLPSFARAVLNRSKHCQADIADLNWGRTEGWRQLFASVFKGKKALEEIKCAKKIEIQYNSRKTDYLCHTNIQAIYLQAWVAVQLGWRLNKGATGALFQYANGVEVKLIPKKVDAVSSGRILAIDILADRDVHYSFKRKERDPHHVLIEKSSLELCTLPTNYVLDKDASGQSLVKEICHQGTSAHYIKVLELLSTIQSESLCHE